MSRLQRVVDGLFLLDKPSGLSSNAALQKVKRLFGAKKAGHTGSLDPLATGVLPICFGQATKFSRYLLDATKGYDARIKLGETTTTGDAEGTVTAVKEVRVDSAQLPNIFEQFRGRIMQKPPMYSAIRQNGQRLYVLARQGIEVERPAREVHIYELEKKNFEQPFLDIEVVCSKGTYIRTLAEDIGHALGCGAHICTLRRTGVAQFRVKQAMTLAQLETVLDKNDGDVSSLDPYVLPIQSMLIDLPSLRLSPSMAYYMRSGQAVYMPINDTLSQGLVSLLSEEDQFIGIGEVLDDGRIAPRRLISAVA